MDLVLHQTHNQIADFDSILAQIKEVFLHHLQVQELHVFPECFLGGYPLQDLCLQRPFIEQYESMLREIDTMLRSLPASPKKALIGGLQYKLHKNDLPRKIYNIVYEASTQTGLTPLYAKQLLPNYDIFDEKKYFSPGHGPVVYQWQGIRLGLLICEDMWASNLHPIDPVEQLEEIHKNEALDLILNLSASPYSLQKVSQRQIRAKEISIRLNCPFAYLNRVGGEDEILFDGASFICDKDQIIQSAKSFEQDCLTWTLEKKKIGSSTSSSHNSPIALTWESLFSPQLNLTESPARIQSLSKQELDNCIQALSFGLQEYAQKSGFSKFLVALSGGLDSSVVLTLARMSLQKGQELEALYMPSKYSSPISRKLSEDLCKNLGVCLREVPIKFLHSSVQNVFRTNIREPLQGFSDENVQSRLRGMLLYARSNQTGAMVINTSNKSELGVGYSTQYGDSVGAISLLGDLYKTEVFQLARHINDKYQLIPTGIIERPPSAELRSNQTDDQSLPPYDRLDPILEGILSYRLGKTQLLELGFTEKEIDLVLHLYNRSEFKRFQFCPIVKVKTKSFGFGYRVPMTKSKKFYF